MACKPIFAFHAIYHFAFLYRTLDFTHNLKKNQKHNRTPCTSLGRIQTSHSPFLILMRKRIKIFFKKSPVKLDKSKFCAYIMSVVFEKTPSVFLRSAVVVLRCSSSLFAIKHPPLFHFGGQRVIFSFPAPYNTARNSVIFKISRLNA